MTSGGDEQRPMVLGKSSNPEATAEIKDVAAKDMSASITPPEVFPREAKGEAVEVIDMDATPKPPVEEATTAIEQSERPTPTPSPMK